MTATGADEALVVKFAAVLPQLDERQRRLLLGAEAISLGRGGITAVAIAAGVSRPMVTRGVAEVRAGASAGGRIRRPGGGRKSLTETDPGLTKIDTDPSQIDCRTDGPICAPNFDAQRALNQTAIACAAGAIAMTLRR